MPLAILISRSILTFKIEAFMKGIFWNIETLWENLWKLLFSKECSCNECNKSFIETDIDQVVVDWIWYTILFICKWCWNSTAFDFEDEDFPNTIEDIFKDEKKREDI